MSEKMLRVSLKDLDTIRVKCKGKFVFPSGKSDEPCGMTYEIAVARAWAFFKEQKCPRCGQVYLNQRHGNDPMSELPDPLMAISKAIENLKRMDGQLEVEFDVLLKE